MLPREREMKENSLISFVFEEFKLVFAVFPLKISKTTPIIRILQTSLRSVHLTEAVRDLYIGDSSCTEGAQEAEPVL